MKMRKEKIILLASTLLIVLVVGIFIVSSVTGNPLKGKWMSEEAGYYLEIDDEGEADLKVTIQQTAIEVDLYYTLDKDAKTISFKGDLESFEDEAEDSNGVLTAADIDSYLTEILTAFDYSLENDTLTLAEREYGEQFIFTRVK